nr:hypothetical protein [Tanacetum cinerariifolium]
SVGAGGFEAVRNQGLAHAPAPRGRQQVELHQLHGVGRQALGRENAAAAQHLAIQLGYEIGAARRLAEQLVQVVGSLVVVGSTRLGGAKLG